MLALHVTLMISHKGRFDRLCTVFSVVYFEFFMWFLHYNNPYFEKILSLKIWYLSNSKGWKLHTFKFYVTLQCHKYSSSVIRRMDYNFPSYVAYISINIEPVYLKGDKFKEKFSKFFQIKKIINLNFFDNLTKAFATYLISKNMWS